MRPAPRSVKAAVVIAVVLAAGAGIRLWGIGHGSPDTVFHPDAGKLAKAARLAWSGEFDPKRSFGDDWSFSAYPYGFSLIVGGSLRLLDAMTRAPARPSFDEGEGKWYWSLRLRYGAVLLFLAASLAVLLRLRGELPPSGLLLTGLLLVLEPMGVQYSHYGMNDVPLTAFLMLAWAASANVNRDRASRPTFSFLSGLCLGIAFGVKYQALLGAVFLLPPWIAGWRERGGAWLLGAAAAGTAGALAGVAFTAPGILDPRWFAHNFFPFMEWQSNIVSQDIGVPWRVWQSTRVLARMVLPSGQWLLLPAFLLPLVSPNRSPAAARRATSSAVLFCAALLAVLAGLRAFPRSNDLVPLWPFLVIIMGKESFAGARPRPRLLALCSLALAWFAVTSLLDCRALAGTDTRLQARQWCRGRVRPGDVVIREEYTLPVGVPGAVEKVVGTMAAPAAKARVLKGQYDFALYSSLAYERFFDPLSPYFDEKKRDFYRHVFDRGPLLAEFRGRRLYFANPVVSVYGRPPGPPDTETADEAPGR